MLASLPLPVSFSLRLKVIRHYVANVFPEETATVSPCGFPRCWLHGEVSSQGDPGLGGAGSFSGLCADSRILTGRPSVCVCALMPSP